MPYHDLNVVYTTLAEVSDTLAFHHELGYNVVALTTTVRGGLPTPLPLIRAEELSKNRDANMTVLTRITLTISDTTQNHRLSALQAAYDIVALRPDNEKSLQLCCSSLDCDLISMDFSQRFIFPFRFTTVASALQRGIRFEICYSPGIAAGSDARVNLISNATALIRATRGRGIIISSEARSALEVRAPADLINLAQFSWGLGQERGKEALCEETEKVVRLADLKRNGFRGVVKVVDGGKAATRSSQNQTTTAMPVNAKQNHPLPHHHVAENVTKQTAPNNNSVKRKASTTSLSQSQAQNLPTATNQEQQKQQHSPSKMNSADDHDQNKPLSKREIKRRAKKARLGGQT